MKNLRFLSAAGLALALAGCGGDTASTNGASGAGSGGNSSASSGGDASSALTGAIKGDGSSTVFPITEAIAEEFGNANKGVQVTVGVSGTGGGFKKFIAGDTELQNASRPIEAKELKGMADKGREFIELPIAYDGLSVVVNPKNTWAKCMTVAQLKKVWEPGSKINNWNQIDPSFPNRPLKLYGAGTDSGTFDYFTKEINGKEKASRSDYTASEDDNTLVQGVSRDIGALGYFGFAYYEENKDKLKLIEVNGGNGCIAPAPDTISSNTYQPLSRPLFIYIERKAADKPEMQAFVKFALEQGPELVKQVGYVPLPQGVYDAAKKRFDGKIVGSVYKTEADEAKPLTELFK